MRFWDTSALVPLLVQEGSSAKARSWMRQDDAIVAWTLTPVEIASALQRRQREGLFDERQLSRVATRAQELLAASRLVVDVERVKALAVRLLRVHALRAADAMQLGAALVWASIPEGRVLHTFDEQLARAAEREGFITAASE